MQDQQEILQTLNPKKRWWKWGIFALVVCIGVGIVVYWYHKPTQQKISYMTVYPTYGEISADISATGTLYPLNEVQIGSQISGMIKEIYVDTNDTVTQGQVLAKIDDSKLIQQLSRYQAQLQGAKAHLLSLQSTIKDKKWQYDRLKKLYKQSKGQFPSFAELQSAEVAYDVAKAGILTQEATIAEIQTNIISTELDLDHTIITSPIDGVVLERSVDAGQTVAASFSSPELFKVAQNLQEMKLVVKISESDIGQIALGQPVRFSVDAYPYRTFKAQVDKINYGSSTTDNIVSYEVSIYVKNDEMLLRPGMSAMVHIQVASQKDILLLPVSALYFVPQEPTTQGKKSSSALIAPMRKRPIASSTPKPIKEGKRTIYSLQNGKPTKQEVIVKIFNGKLVGVEGISKDIEVISGVK